MSLFNVRDEEVEALLKRLLYLRAKQIIQSYVTRKLRDMSVMSEEEKVEVNKLSKLLYAKICKHKMIAWQEYHRIITRNAVELLINALDKYVEGERHE